MANEQTPQATVANDQFNIRRFVFAQDGGVYEQALNEVKRGSKCTHWIWFIFPQIAGLPVHSHNSIYYAISCPQEARAYLDHPVLGPRLREICQALLDCGERDPGLVFGKVDAQKVFSCMTLFDYVSPDDIFAQVLKQCYADSRDLRSRTLIIRAANRYAQSHPQ